MPEPFCKENDNDTSDKAECGIEDGDLLPPEMGMFVGKNKAKDTGDCNTDIEDWA